MKRLDCRFGIFWLLLSLGVCIRSYQIGFGDMRNPGPGFLFFVSGVILLGLSLLVLVPAFRTPVQDDEKNIFGNVNWKKVIAIIVTLTGYGLALEPLGFLISTVFFIGFLLYSIGAKKMGCRDISILGFDGLDLCPFRDRVAVKPSPRNSGHMGWRSIADCRGMISFFAKLQKEG